MSQACNCVDGVCEGRYGTGRCRIHESPSARNGGEPKACTPAEERGIAGATGAGQLPDGNGGSTRDSAERRSPAGIQDSPALDESNRHPTKVPPPRPSERWMVRGQMVDCATAPYLPSGRAKPAKECLDDKELISAVITAVMSSSQSSRDAAVLKLQGHILRVEEERDQREAECERLSMQVRNARAAAMEEAARAVEIISADWSEAGSLQKVYAADYIAQWLRDLAKVGGEGSSQTKEPK